MIRPTTPRRRCAATCLPALAAAVLLLFARPHLAAAAITESQVLVVYNSAAADATALKNAYLAAHPGIPAANVLDLNNPMLATGLPSQNVTYAQFISWIRDPIRAYLAQAGPPEPPDIIAIVLLRPLPHRIYDTDNLIVGDNPGALVTEFLPPSNGGVADATCASVDAELVLLWQNLDAGEAGGTMDSKSDNLIDNPYHGSATAIHLISRANIGVQKTFTAFVNVVWTLGGTGATRLGAGDMYLVCRIDGPTLADAEAVIDRGRDLYYNKALLKLLIDKTPANLDHDSLFTPPSSDPFYAGLDYEEAQAALLAGGWNLRFDAVADFIDCTEETGRLAAYASYGENNVADGLGEDPPGIGTYPICYNWGTGAIFNTIESFNGRAFNGVGQHPSIPQGQVSDFLAAGGAFGIGMVWEPFGPFVADNEFLLPRMLSGQFTWAEAAYMAIPCLSWQHIVLGDALAAPGIINDPALPLGDMNGDGRSDALDIDWFTNVLANGIGPYRAALPALDPVARGDFNGDRRVTIDDAPGLIALLLAP
jgi:hypothetical protein